MIHSKTPVTRNQLEVHRNRLASFHFIVIVRAMLFLALAIDLISTFTYFVIVWVILLFLPAMTRPTPILEFATITISL